jgi:hypothetical protein
VQSFDGLPFPRKVSSINYRPLDVAVEEMLWREKAVYFFKLLGGGSSCQKRADKQTCRESAERLPVQTGANVNQARLGKCQRDQIVARVFDTIMAKIVF